MKRIALQFDDEFKHTNEDPQSINIREYKTSYKKNSEAKNRSPLFCGIIKYSLIITVIVLLIYVLLNERKNNKKLEELIENNSPITLHSKNNTIKNELKQINNNILKIKDKLNINTGTN